MPVTFQLPDLYRPVVEFIIIVTVTVWQYYLFHLNSE